MKTIARVPRPCPTCGRLGDCADCCCVDPDHHRETVTTCGLCEHPTRQERT